MDRRRASAGGHHDHGARRHGDTDRCGARDFTGLHDRRCRPALLEDGWPAARTRADPARCDRGACVRGNEFRRCRWWCAARTRRARDCASWWRWQSSGRQHSQRCGSRQRKQPARIQSRCCGAGTRGRQHRRVGARGSTTWSVVARHSTRTRAALSRADRLRCTQQRRHDHTPATAVRWSRVDLRHDGSCRSTVADVERW